MRIDADWFTKVKLLIIETTALVSLLLAAIGLLVYEFRHLF